MRNPPSKPRQDSISRWRRYLVHSALPVVTLAGLGFLGLWLVTADPGPEVGPSTSVEPRPRPSSLSGIRFVSVVGDHVTHQVEAATATFDFNEGWIYYQDIHGIVNHSDFGRVPFRADRGRSRIAEAAGQPDLAELQVESLDLEGNVRTGGSFAGEHGEGLRYNVLEGTLKSLEAEVEARIPGLREDTGEEDD